MNTQSLIVDKIVARRNTLSLQMNELQALRWIVMSARTSIATGLRPLRDLWYGADPSSPEALTDQSDSGAALVEFTVLMPVIMLIMFGMVQFGSMIWLQNTMTNAAREGARTASVTGGTVAAANTAACRWLSASAGKTFSISSTTSTTTPLCPNTVPASPCVNTVVTLNKSDASLLNTFLSITNSGNIASSSWAGQVGASVTMANENGSASATASCQCNTSGGTPSGC